MNRYLIITVALLSMCELTHASEWLFGVEITPRVGQKREYHYYKDKKKVVTNGVVRTRDHLLKNTRLWTSLLNFKRSETLQDCHSGKYRVIKNIDSKKEVFAGCLEDPSFKLLLKQITSEIP